MAGLALKVIGVVGLASYAVAYACTKLRHVSYHRYRLVAVPAEGLPAMPRGYTWRELSPEELAAQTIDAGPEAQAERFAAGMSCLGVFDRKGELAGVTWVRPQIHEERDHWVRYLLPADAAWDTGLWIPEDKRMSRAFAAVWAALGEWLHRNGLKWSMSSIADYNIPSLLSHQRLGAHALRWCVVVRIGPVQISFGARPLFYIKGRANLPTVRLRTPPAEALALG